MGAGTGPEQKINTTQGDFFCSGLGRRHGARAKKKTPPRVFFFFLLRPRGKAGEGEASLGAGTGPEQKKTPPRVFFFDPALGAGTGPEQNKKKNTQGVFLCSGPGERQGKEKPRWAPARGQSKKKNTTQGVCFFFLLQPKAREGEAPLGAGTGPEQKKIHHPGCFFFWLRPPGKAGEGEAPLGAGTGPEQKKKKQGVFFCSGLGRRHGARAKKKKHHPGCFFFAPAPGKGRGRRSFVGRRHGARAKKKNTTQGVFFFFFAPAPGKGRGRRSFVGRRHGARAKNKHHPGCFFLLRPWAPARGQSKKKKHHPGCFFFCSGPGGKAGEGEASLGAGTGPEQKKKNTTQGVFFFDPALGAGTGPEQNIKKHPARVFFFAPAPGQGRGRRSPVGRRHGARAKTQGVFFLLRPRRKAGEGEAPLGAGTGPEQKNKHHPGCVFFFYCGRRQGKEKLRWAPARGQSQKKNTTQGVVFFFAPATGKGRGRRSPVGRRHGARAKKRTPPMVICFFCCGPGEWQGKEKPRWAPARGQSKKKTPPRVCVFFFFFAAAPAKGRGRRSLVGRRHGARAKKEKHPGCFCFFCCGPDKRQGEVDAATFRRGQNSLWAGAISARPDGAFFLLWPRRVFFV